MKFAKRIIVSARKDHFDKLGRTGSNSKKRSRPASIHSFLVERTGGSEVFACSYRRVWGGLACAFPVCRTMCPVVRTNSRWNGALAECKSGPSRVCSRQAWKKRRIADTRHGEVSATPAQAENSGKSRQFLPPRLRSTTGQQLPQQCAVQQHDQRCAQPRQGERNALDAPSAHESGVRCKAHEGDHGQW
jgi:hypothetical protein